MTTSTSLLFLPALLLSAFLSCSSVSASPTGASACGGGMAAVGSTHLSDTATTGTLEESPQGLKVELNGALVMADAPSTFAVGETATLTLSGSSAFKGFLLRLSPGGATLDANPEIASAFTVVDDATTQMASVCTDPAAGVTHTDNMEKTSVTVNLDFANAAELALDVTVVIVNTGGVSEYYYTGYTISAGDAAVDDGMESHMGGNATMPETPGEGEPAAPEPAEPGAPAEPDAPAPAPDAPAPAPDAPAPSPTEPSGSIQSGSIVTGLLALLVGLVAIYV